jgi:tetratricopeptide (TPR) repeat protein
VAFNKGEYDHSLEWHRKALKIFQQTLQLNHRHLAHSRNCIGSAYENKGKFRQVLGSYKEALVIYQQALGKDHCDVAVCFGNMGNIYQEEKKYSKASNIIKKH